MGIPSSFTKGNGHNYGHSLLFYKGQSALLWAFPPPLQRAMDIQAAVEQKAYVTSVEIQNAL